MNAFISDHPPAELLNRYYHRQLRAAELLAVDDHLTACVQCRKQMDEIRPLHTVFQVLKADMAAAAAEVPEHLSPEQLADYVNERLDEFDVELAAGHLELCPQCRAREQKLRAAVAVPPPGLSWWKRAVQWWAGQTLVWRVAEAVALAVLLVWGVTLWQGRTVKPPLLAGPPSPVPTATSPLPAPASSPAIEQFALVDGGGQVTLDAEGRWTGYGPFSLATNSLLVGAVRSGQVKLRPAPPRLSTSSGVMMGGEPEKSFALRDPIRVIVLSDQPLLRWRPLPEATSYQVEIDDVTGRLRQNIVTSPLLTATQWRVTTRLARGGFYRWRVVALKGGAPIVAPPPGASDARFKVLEASKAAEIMQAKKDYAGKHLLLGLLYAEVGLAAEAEAELKALVAANPQAPVARQLLRNLQLQIKPQKK